MSIAAAVVSSMPFCLSASAVAGTVALPLEDGGTVRISAAPGAVDTSRWPIVGIRGQVRIEAYGDCQVIEPQPDRPLAVNFKTKADWQSTITALRFLTGFTTWKGIRSCGDSTPRSTARAPSGPDFIFLWGAGQPRYKNLPVNVHLAQAHVDASIEAKVKAGVAIINVIAGKELLRFDPTRILTASQLERRHPVVLVQYYPEISILSGPTVQSPNPATSAIAGVQAIDVRFDSVQSDVVQSHTKWISRAIVAQRAGANCLAGVFTVESIVGNAQIKMAGGIRDDQEADCLFRGLLYTIGIDAKDLSADPGLIRGEMNRGTAILPNNAIKILDPIVVDQIRTAVQ